jgi:tetratricopeptide (TPR) repeat protein
MGLDEYFKALNLFNEIGSFAGITSIYSNLCYVHLFCGDHKSAVDCLKMTKKYSEKFKSKFWIGRNLMLEGKIQSDQGNVQKALDLFNQAYSLFDEIGDSSKMGEIFNEIVTSNLKMKNLEVLHELKKDYLKLLKSHLTKSSKEKLLTAGLKIDMSLDRKSDYFKPENLSFIDNFDFENLFDIYTTLAKYFDKIIKDKKLSQKFVEKAKNHFLNILENLPDNFRNSMSKRNDYLDFIKEYSA